MFLGFSFSRWLTIIGILAGGAAVVANQADVVGPEWAKWGAFAGLILASLNERLQGSPANRDGGGQ